MSARALAILSAVLLVGCAQRPTIIPNSDPALRKTSVEFSADAAKRQYPAAESTGKTLGSAQVGYTFNTLEVVNFSDEDWTDVEVWVNKEYVVYVPLIQHLQKDGSGRTKTLNFRMFYNRNGQSFPIDNMKTRIDLVQIYRDGKLYDVPLKLAD